MRFIQYEVWGALDGHEELFETYGTLKEAEEFVENNLEFHDEMWILEDTDEDLKEIRRFKGL
jgi:hypothetical protein